MWRSIAGRDPKAVGAGDPRREIALEACRAGDQLDRFAVILEAEGLTLLDGKGETRVHPALVETNRLRALQARLIVALRLPDETTGQKPQSRPLRGVMPRTGEHAKVSALNEARRAAS